MHKIVFTEEFCNPGNLFPFTLTRQVQDIRVGILTIREKWERHLGCPSFDKFEDDYKDLDRAVRLHDFVGDDTVYLVHGNILPTRKLIGQVKGLQAGEFLSVPEAESIVYCLSKGEVLDEHNMKVGRPVDVDEDLKEIKAPWDISRLNAWAIEEDFELLTAGRSSGNISPTNHVFHPSAVFIENGATVEGCFLNAQAGPIYVGKGAQVMEGSMIRGPVAVCDEAVVKMGTRLYEGTTVGPKCTVGGEIKNSVLFGYSNKAHDGYMGDSVIGEWCNWGAGTSNSNVKNNASGVIVWTPSGAVNAGLKCGVFMGDYSRTAINTSINTGTVVGVCANLFSSGLSPKFIPSFSWGSDGLQRYHLEKAFADINNWKRLKGSEATASEKAILKHIFEHY